MIDIDYFIKISRKQKDYKSLRYYQNVKTEFVKIEKETRNSLTENLQIKILANYIKKLRDAEKQYFQAGREDLAVEYRDESDTLQKLLPEPISPQKIYNFLYDYCMINDFHNDDIITIPKKFMGTIIKIMKETFPTADGKMISEIVKSYLV